MSVLKNVKVNWCSIHTPNTQFEPAWEVQVIMDRDQARALQAEAKAVHKKGITIKEEEDGSYSFRFKRLVARKDGSENTNNPPACVDAHRAPFKENIGNGSVCNVQYSLVAWANKFGTGVTSDFKGIQVLEHVAYGSQDGGEFEDESEGSEEPQEESEFEAEDKPAKPAKIIKPTKRTKDEFDDEDFQ